MANDYVCDTKLGYYALALCIATDRTPESAFKYLSEGRLSITDTYDPAVEPLKKRAEITAQDIEDMIYMKKTMTYKQIGMLYGLSDQAVYQRIKCYKVKRQREAVW